MGKTEVGLQGTLAPSSGSLLAVSSHVKQPFSLCFLVSQVSKLAFTKHFETSKVLCRYDHIVIKSRETKCFDEVKA